MPVLTQSNFNPTPLNSHVAGGQQAAPTKKSGGGLRGALRGLIQAPEYFLKTDILNPAVENIAMLKGDKAVQAEARKNTSRTIGATPGEAFKKLAGNTAQLAGTAVSAGGAGLLPRIGAGIKGGSLIGGGSAAANNQDIVKGAAEGAAVGGVLPVGFKALGLAGKGATATAGKTFPKENGFVKNLLTTGEQMQGRAPHISGGEKVGPKQIFPKDTTRMLNTLKSEGVPLTGNANTTARALDDRLAQHANTITQVLDKSNKPLSATDKKALLKEYADKIDKNPSIDNPARKAAQNLANNLDKHGSADVKSLVNFTRGLDKDALNYNANPDAATTAKQLAARTLRQVVKDRINKLAPELKVANSSYHDLAEIRPFLAKGMLEQNQPTGGIAGRLASSGPIQKAETTLGKGIEKTAKGMGAGNPAEAPLVAAEQNRAKVALGNILQPATTLGEAASAGNPAPAEAPQDAGGMNTLLPDTTATADATQQNDTPFTSEAIQRAILADIQSTGGKNIAALTSLYKTFGTPSKTSVKAQDAEASGSQALNIVDNLEQAFNNAGGAKGRIGGTVGSILGKAGANDAANIYNEDKMAFLSNVARSLGEKGVLTDADIDRIAKAFPGLTSTPGEAAAKWSMIKTIISGGIQKAQTAYANSSSPNSEGSSLIQ